MRRRLTGLGVFTSTPPADGIDELTVHQGVEIGRPSRIDCAWAGDRPRASGDIVVLADGDALLGQG